MKLILAALAATLTLGALPAMAQESTLAFNASVTSDYRYRGISQTRLKPAVQGGIDYGHSSGFYIGTWASSIKWVKDFGGDSDYELDVYGGYKTELATGLNMDIGVLTYIYPSNKLNPSANTTELYGALSYGPITTKLSYAVTDTFANPDSEGSWYFDLTGAFEIADGWMLTPHVGYQRIAGPFKKDASYTDYSLALSKDFSGFVPSIAFVGTDADKNFYVPGPQGNSTKFLGKNAVVVSLKYNF
jgi:uncharacterized protein (TIGR02001 family)